MENIKKLKRIIIFILVIITTMSSSIYATQTNDMSQTLNSLELNFAIQSNGNVIVTEYWDITLHNTNTLYKNFYLNDNKISGVSIEEMIDGVYRAFKKTQKYEYHLDENTCYAINKSPGLFEIAWGTGSEQKDSRKKYKVMYTIENAINNYIDCSEFYWQPLGSKFNISAKKIKGKITLPNGISNKSDIRAWGHIESLNGNIRVKDTKTITFNVNRYPGNMELDIRVMIPNNIISGKIVNKAYKDQILQEEKAYAESTNDARMKYYLIELAVLVAILGAMYFEIISIIKHIKTKKQNEKDEQIPQIDYEFFREIPNEKTTPGQAVFLANSRNEAIHGDFADIFVATVLDLIHKGFFEVKSSINKKAKKKLFEDQYSIDTYLELTEKSKIYRARMKLNATPKCELEEDEVKILEYLLKFSKDYETIEIKRINDYINENKNNAAEFLELKEEVQNKIEVAQSVKGNVNHDNSKLIKKYKEEASLNSIIIIFTSLAIFKLIQYVPIYWIIGMLLVIGSALINLWTIYKIRKILPFLTNQGLDEHTKWKGLKNFINDYSLLSEKTEVVLEVWEGFLIYATALGISKEVLKQLNPVVIENNKNKDEDNDDYDNENRNNLLEIRAALNIEFRGFSSAEGFGGGFSSTKLRRI